MNKRERMLVGAAAILVLGVGGNWVVRQWILAPLSERRTTLENLDRTLQERKLAAAELLAAEVNLNRWRQNALPGINLADAKSVYQGMLNAALQQAGISKPTVSPTNTSGTRESFISLLFSVEFNCDLKALSSLLYQFYRTDLLHRIKVLKIDPHLINDKLVDFKVHCDVEVLAFRDGLAGRNKARPAMHNDGRKLTDFHVFADKNVFQPTDVVSAAQTIAVRVIPPQDERADVKLAAATSRDGAHEVWFYNDKSKKSIKVRVGGELNVAGMKAKLVSFDFAGRQALLEVTNKIGSIRMGQALSSWKPDKPSNLSATP